MLTDSVDKSSSAFFVFMLLFVCVLIISVRNLIAIFYVKIDNVPYRLFISNIPNCELSRKIEVAEVDYIGRYKLGRKTRGSQEKMGIFLGLPDSRCMFSTSVPKEKKG